MTPKTILELLTIAEKANQWEVTKPLRDAALRELSSAYLSTVETITPVMIVNGKETEHGGEDERAGKTRTRSVRES